MSQSLTKGRVLFNGNIVATNASFPFSNTTIYINTIDLGSYTASSDVITVSMRVNSWSGTIYNYPIANTFIRLRVHIYDAFGNIVGLNDAYGPYAYAESPWLTPYATWASDSVTMVIDLGGARTIRLYLDIIALVQNNSANVTVSVEG